VKGRREGGKEGRREGGKEGKEGKKEEGKREGGIMRYKEYVNTGTHPGHSCNKHQTVTLFSCEYVSMVCMAMSGECAWYGVACVACVACGGDACVMRNA
jgi:hypothetical protein